MRILYDTGTLQYSYLTLHGSKSLKMINREKVSINFQSWKRN